MIHAMDNVSLIVYINIDRYTCRISWGSDYEYLMYALLIIRDTFLQKFAHGVLNNNLLQRNLQIYNL